MMDEDRDDVDGGVGGGGVDRRSVVDGNGCGGAGRRTGDVSKKTMATEMTTTRSKRKIFSDGKVGGRDNDGRRRGGRVAATTMMTRRGADAIAKTAKAMAEERENCMMDEDRDDVDGGVGGGGADRRCVVDGDGDGGAGRRTGDALKKTMAMVMRTTRNEREIFSDGKVGGTDNDGRRRGGEGCRYYHDDKEGGQRNCQDREGDGQFHGGQG